MPGWLLQARYKFGFYGSLIIAALAAGCTQLYSEDLRRGQKFEDATELAHRNRMFFNSLRAATC